MQPFTFAPKKPLQTPAPLGMADINALNSQGAQEPMKIDDWMKQNASDFDHPMHDKTRRFLSGPHKGRTPEQVATKLAQQHAKGLASPQGAIGHGAAGGLDTPGNAMSPEAWKARFQRPAAPAAANAAMAPAAPAAPATMPMQGANAGVGTVLKPPTGTGTVLQNPATPNPLDFAGSMMKPPMAAKPAAVAKNPNDPFYRTMTGKYGSGSANNITPVPGVRTIGGKQYHPDAFTPAVATPPVDPLAPNLKKSFFA